MVLLVKLYIFPDMFSRVMSYIKMLKNILLLFTILLVVFTNTADAAVNVNARVGNNSLLVSGKTSPYASVALNSEGDFVASTVADNSGNFSFKNLPIKNGFSQLCLDLVDSVKGEKLLACFSFAEAEDDLNFHDLILVHPKTEAISKFSGYVYPDSLATITLDTDQIEGKADEMGFFQIEVENKSVQRETGAAGSEGEVKRSIQDVKELYSKPKTPNWNLTLGSAFSNILEWALWIGLAIIIFVIIPISWKLWPQVYSGILSKVTFGLVKKKKAKGMHHSWFMGY